MKTYPKGSEWRKWDLHIHTPKSIIQNYGGDNETSWDAFIQKIASLPSEIKVIAVTDYLFCDGYKYILERKDEIPNIDLIIPNIEFRLDTFSGKENNSKRHNLHILFDPSVGVSKIQGQLLNCLSNAYKITDATEWHQTPTFESLAELGREIKAAAPTGNTVNKKSDIEVGFDNITYKLEDIMKLLEKDCFKGKYAIAIGYSEWDQSRWDQSAAEKRNLINSANFCLTCLDDPAKINENREDLIKNKLNSIVLHSSDAHGFDRIGSSLLWVKADPTFAGLKQMLNEPEDRIFIGEVPPNYKHDHGVITKISIPNSNGWFADNLNLELNRDLITIIGGRGSGKSALAEAIAYGAGSWDDSGDAFFKKAAKHKASIIGAEIYLKWGDGTDTYSKVGDLEEDRGLVRYLPQGVVEKLCSPNNSDELRNQIENVIFQALGETDRMGASDFDQLRSRILKNSQYEKEQIFDSIKTINSKIFSLTKVLNGLPEKKRQFSEKKSELEKLIKGLPELPQEDKKGQEELSKLLESKKFFESKIIELQSMLSRISEISTKIKIFKGKIAEFNQDINTLLSAVGISETSAFEVRINETSINSILDGKNRDILSKINILKEGNKSDVIKLIDIPIDDLLFDNLTMLDKGIGEKQKTTRAFETTKLKYQQQKKIIHDSKNNISNLETEIKKIETETEPEKDKLQEERIELYISYFELLKKERLKISEIYKPLQDSLSAGTDTDKKLVFQAQINHDFKRHINNGLNIIDRTRKGNFRDQNNLKEVLNSIEDCLFREDYKKDTIKKQIDKVLNKFNTFDGKKISIEDQLREGRTIEDFYNWLFDPTYFEIVSSLQFDGTDLYLLSPGQKGVILLMLYLEIDKGDYRPLIIDQPEENLDNLSVYKDLIGYFKEREQYRQIIMVTHNPNLVVNTDSEQIVISNYNGKRTPILLYHSGSLEYQAKAIPSVAVESFEDGIIEQVCSILEGGEIAFENRKKKYQISLKSQIK